jgi:Peptidase M10 serralysin C terminal
VFAANSSHDTIVNFMSGEDHIDLSAIVATSDVASWMADHVAASSTNPADTLVTIDAANTILLKNASVGASDFIVHP